MAKMKKRADGRYMMNVYLGLDEKGKQKYKSVYGKTQKEVKQKAEEMAAETGREREFRLLSLIEELTPSAYLEVRGKDNVKCANVDLYSGFVYSMLGIPADLYTPMFAIARLPGWCAHRIEEVTYGGRIIRPAGFP